MVHPQIVASRRAHVESLRDMRRELAVRDDLLAAALHDVQMFKSVIKMREREIEQQATQIAVLKLMLAQARGEAWTG